MTPWLQAKSDSQRIRKLFNASGIGEVEMSDVVIPGGNLGGFKAKMVLVGLNMGFRVRG